MFKKSFSCILATIMICALTPIVSAVDVDSPSEKTLIAVKQEIIAGIPTTVRQYMCDNSVVVETFTIDTMNVSEEAMDAFGEAISNRPAPQIVSPHATPRSAPDVGNLKSKSFVSRGFTQDDKGTIAQNGRFWRGSDSHSLDYYVWVEDSRSVATYSEANNVPSQISMKLDLVTSGISLSLGIPPSISGSVNVSSRTLDLGTFTNTTAATAYWPNYGGYNKNTTNFKLEVSSSVVFVFGSRSYAAFTTNSANYEFW